MQHRVQFVIAAIAADFVVLRASFPDALALPFEAREADGRRQCFQNLFPPRPVIFDHAPDSVVFFYLWFVNNQATIDNSELLQQYKSAEHRVAVCALRLASHALMVGTAGSFLCIEISRCNWTA